MIQIWAQWKQARALLSHNIYTETNKIVGQNTGNDTVCFRSQDIVILFVPDSGLGLAPSKMPAPPDTSVAHDRTTRGGSHT